MNPDSSCTQPPRAGTGNLFSQNPSTGHPWSAAVCPPSQRGHLRAVPGSDVAPRAAPTAERIRPTPSKTSTSYRRPKGRTPFLQRRMNAAVTGRLGGGAVDSTAEGISQEKGYM